MTSNLKPLTLPAGSQTSIAPICHTSPLTCRLCGHNRVLSIGSKDFGHSGHDHFSGARVFPDYGVAIQYHRCQACGVVVTSAFDDWTPLDFQKHIYNADYVLADPPFAGERAERNAALVAGLWHRQRGELAMLDYGGGAGVMSAALASQGFDCVSCDPFHGNASPSRRFAVVTCFEVLEHVRHGDQYEWLKTLAEHVEPGGTVLLSTEVFDADLSVNHWYLCPRNGHITVHSPRSLKQLANRCGFELFSANREMHFLRCHR